MGAFGTPSTYLSPKQFPTSQCIKLIHGHQLRHLYTRHLLDNLSHDEQIKALAGLQLIGHVLQQTRQLDVVLAEHGAAESGQTWGGEGGGKKKRLPPLVYELCFVSPQELL